MPLHFSKASPRLAWFETLLNDRQLLLGCPPPAADITCQQFNVSIRVRHKPVLKPVLEPFCLCRLSGRKWREFTRYAQDAHAIRQLMDNKPVDMSLQDVLTIYRHAY